MQTNTLIIPPSIRQITLERIDQLFHMNMLLTITEIPLETAQGQIEHSGGARVDHTPTYANFPQVDPSVTTTGACIAWVARLSGCLIARASAGRTEGQAAQFHISVPFSPDETGFPDTTGDRASERATPQLLDFITRARYQRGHPYLLFNSICRDMKRRRRVKRESEAEKQQKSS